MAKLLAVVAAGIVLAGCSGGYDLGEIEAERHRYHAELVGRYCVYGAVSEAQFYGCVHHVPISAVENRSTNAARWAQSPRSRACLADAGPMCGDRGLCYVESFFGPVIADFCPQVRQWPRSELGG